MPRTSARPVHRIDDGALANGTTTDGIGTQSDKATLLQDIDKGQQTNAYTSTSIKKHLKKAWPRKHEVLPKVSKSAYNELSALAYEFLEQA
jgi:hypothetical protein